MGRKDKAFAIGALLSVYGGAGLAEISTSDHGCFWLCTVALAVGLGLCLWSYER